MRNTQDTSGQSQRALHSKGKPIKEMERETIIDALFAHNGNRTHTAKALGMSLRTLRHKLKQYKEDGFFVDGTRQNQIGNNGRVNLGDAELVPLTGQNAAGWEIAQLTRGEA
jgi:transposase